MLLPGFPIYTSLQLAVFPLDGIKYYEIYCAFFLYFEKYGMKSSRHCEGICRAERAAM